MGVFGLGYGPVVDSIASSSVRRHTVDENVYGSRVVQVALHFSFDSDVFFPLSSVIDIVYRALCLSQERKGSN
ncbi:unnamed protein product [Toxocara canis]|uniref:Secreted protein n=1 Tax=Toxocara canis TaxID=6265 RepID=A0A183UGN3_TOXCA|nr:unnamed protein product [Toxocara canis]